MAGESVITGLSLHMKADGLISPPPQNPSILISYQSTYDSYSTVFYFFFFLTQDRKGHEI